MRVLIVEDETLIAMDIEMTVADAGHEVVGLARSASEAIALATEHRPDIVLMDLNLAEGSRGDEAARVISERLGIRSIFLSGSIDGTTRAALGALEPAGLIGKPMQPRDLIGALEAAGGAGS